MTNINIEFLENTKTVEGITEYAVPRTIDGGITMTFTFPESVSLMEKYFQIQSHNERKILKFPSGNTVGFELKNTFNFESKITIEPQAGYDNATKFETITIVRE